MVFSQTSPEERKSRVVFLVARPLNENIDRILRALRVVDPPADTHLAEHVTNVPTTIDNVSVATHLAVGLLDEDDWKSEALTLPEKLQKAQFWEHMGAGMSGSITKIPWSGIPGAGREWIPQDIDSIQAIEVLGRIHTANSEVLNEIFAQLWDGWVYLPVWWNCQDFAIRLAYLFITTDEARRTLVNLARIFRERIVEMLVSARNAAVRCGDYLDNFLDNRKFDGWLTNMTEIEGRIPSLLKFHEDLYDGWDWMHERRIAYWRWWRTRADG
uniref:Uncharacterized protein n=1 Tax=Bionectria ochroleuca TaxID=29856 RepID=A0A0B7KIR1_BIOOC